MANCSAGREKAEACVRALTNCVHIGSDQLRFTWEELEGETIADVESMPGDRLEIVRVFLGSLWSTLFFTESEIGNLDHLSERLFLQHKVDILEALRRLRGLSRPIAESGCLESWMGDGDRFPGEPA